MKTESIAVVQCTYNGQAFLRAQLDSIAQQTRLPNQLVILDDHSTDETVNLLHEWSAICPIPCHVHTHAENLGSTTSFAEVIGLAEGYILVLCDQDDVWFPQKLERIEQEFQANPEAGFVFSDAEMVDGQLQPLGYTLWQAIRFDASERRRFPNGAFESLLKRYRVTGATMAFRAEYRDLVLPIPRSWIHDAWIALLISAVAPCAVIDEPLIRYRQHGSQQIGEKQRGWYGQFLVASQMDADHFQRTADNFALAAARLRGPHRYPVNPAVLKKLDEKVAHWNRRARLHRGGWRWPTIFSEFRHGHYGKYSLGWKSILQDLFL